MEKLGSTFLCGLFALILFLPFDSITEKANASYTAARSLHSSTHVQTKQIGKHAGSSTSALLPRTMDVAAETEARPSPRTRILDIEPQPKEPSVVEALDQVGSETPELQLNREALIRLSNVGQQVDMCGMRAAAYCLRMSDLGLPATPVGYGWKRLSQKYTFSAYVQPSEDEYLGDLVDIPGIQGMKAKEEFLFSVSGLGMQGTGTIYRRDKATQKILPYHIRIVEGHWEVGGEDVIITDSWTYVSTGERVDPLCIPDIRLAEARFSLLPLRDLVPYYSVAGSPEFPLGTLIYVPSLSQFGGTFEINDRGGAFDKTTQRFDMYVGTKMDNALEWFTLNEGRANLDVYVLTRFQ